MSNLDFYLVELSRGLRGYSIAELDSPVELILATSKIITFSWLEAAGSFACISDMKSSGVPTSLLLAPDHLPVSFNQNIFRILAILALHCEL